jgi:hypothetical protein
VKWWDKCHNVQGDLCWEMKVFFKSVLSSISSCLPPSDEKFSDIPLVTCFCDFIL